jgi:hypothetical protein
MWLRNLNSCKVLEQDVGMICSQEVCITTLLHRKVVTQAHGVH